MGFHHVPNEIWYTEDSSTYKVCDGTGEDPTCSDTVVIPSIPDHTDYLNQYTGCGDKSEEELVSEE